MIPNEMEGSPVIKDESARVTTDITTGEFPRQSFVGKAAIDGLQDIVLATEHKALLSGSPEASQPTFGITGLPPRFTEPPVAGSMENQAANTHVLDDSEHTSEVSDTAVFPAQSVPTIEPGDPESDVQFDSDTRGVAPRDGASIDQPLIEKESRENTNTTDHHSTNDSQERPVIREQDRKWEDVIQEYDWHYTEKKPCTQDEFLAEIDQELRERQVVSVGEYHDMNTDTSFGWIEEHTDEIVSAFTTYHQAIEAGEDPPPLRQVLSPDSQLLSKLENDKPTFEELKQMHVGRLFATVIIPHAAKLGYHDLVLELFDPHNPEQVLFGSKDLTGTNDRIGTLLTITMAMDSGMRLHGSIPENLTLESNSDAIFSHMVDLRRDNPDAQVLSYNGSLHNMIVPYPHARIQIGDLSPDGYTDPHDWSFGAQARMVWGSDFGSIDLLNRNRNTTVNSHFKNMVDDAAEGTITRYTHNTDQQSYVLD